MITLRECTEGVLNKDKNVVNLLRENACEAYFFGVGFIKVKIFDHARMHFYHPDLKAFTENPHDHRYNFISTVLAGELETTVYEECTPNTYGKIPMEVSYTPCQKGGEQIEVPEPYPTFIEEVGFFNTKGGSSYYMSKDTFHSVYPCFDAGPCITLLERGEFQKEFARVLHVKDNADACPFGRELSEDEIWKYVEECITL